ncbi:MAG: HAMP domain-containing protein [Chloroflexi bacterium]|nr:HAMP domain-containing protein [Chloroflexota bacterium]
MNNNPSPLKGWQQLRWKLTISYAAVTVGALLTVEIILLGGLAVLLVIMLNSGILQTQLIESASSTYTPVLRFLLTQTPPDQAGIDEWLESIASTPTVPLSFDGTDEMFVVGRNGRLLGSKSSHLLGSNQIGQPLNTQAILGLDGPIQAALNGEEELEKLYTVARPGENVVMAIPIWDANHEQVLGVAAAIVSAPTLVSLLSEVAPILGISLLLFTFIAALIGTAYGFLAARKPVQRLNRLASASEFWSQGDFSTIIDDPAHDELGQLTHRLNNMAQQLDLLLETRSELAILEERNRLARDLHDSVKQQAFAAAAQISGVRALLQRDPEAAETHLSEAEHLIYDLRQELSALILELRPAALEGKGLVAAVGEYVADWSRQNEIVPDLRIQGERALPLTIEQPLFRIAQEALANVARHSKAKQVEIVLNYAHDTIMLTVADDGHGFDVDNRQRGYGLNSMQERAAALGGTLTVESALGQGAIISCTVPAKENSGE